MSAPGEYARWITRESWISEREAFGQELHARLNAGGALVRLSDKPETRTVRSNRYLWGAVYRAIVEFWRETHGKDFTDTAIHETLKELYLPSRVEASPNGAVRIYRTTTQLTKREFGEYVEHIHRWAAELGCVIPEPESDLIQRQTEAA